MFDFKRLILLFSIMFVSIVGVKAEPKYAIVFDVSENMKCCDCKKPLTKIDEQSKKHSMFCKKIVYHSGERSECIDTARVFSISPRGINDLIMNDLNKKICAFIDTTTER